MVEATVASLVVTGVGSGGFVCGGMFRGPSLNERLTFHFFKRMLKNMSEPDSPQTPTSPTFPAEPRTNKRKLALLVCAAAVIGLVCAAYFDRLDSALLFVGIPCLLAFGIGTLPSKPGWGRVLQVVMVCTLLASAILHEAAFCLLLASPIVACAALAGWWLANTAKKRHQIVALPIVLLVASEGAFPDWQLAAGQTARASTILTSDCATVETRLRQGPLPEPSDRQGVLKIAPYPTPTGGSGTGFTTGHTWQLNIGGGTINSVITERSSSAVKFVVTENSSMTNRWVEVESGVVRWVPVQQGCEVELAVQYRRKLAPAVWFGPVTGVFMRAGVGSFLASLT